MTTIDNERQQRIIVLAKMTKVQLLAAWREGPGAGHLWSAAPPENWSRDELHGPHSGPCHRPQSSSV